MFLTVVEKYPFILAFVMGLVPALIWMWFWLKEDRHPEPPKMITLAFIGGMIAVLVVLPLQKFVYSIVDPSDILKSFSLWAAIEEVCKFVIVYFIALRFKKVADEPVDDIIYLIIAALGFVTFENTLFLLNPLRDGNIWGTIVNANLRFMGASLVHIMSSATIGICMALSFYRTRIERLMYTLSGLLIAIVLHTAFNLFILKGAEESIFFIFGCVWLSIVILLLLFERVKHMKKVETLPVSRS